MLWGHEPTPITAPEMAQLLAPNIAPATVRLMLERRSYPEEQEHEAELLATLILERVGARIAEGASLEQVKRAHPTREWDERFTTSFVTSDHVIEEAYHAVTQERRH